MTKIQIKSSVNGCSCCAEGVGYHCGSRLDGCKMDGIYRCLENWTCFLEQDCGADEMQ